LVFQLYGRSLHPELFEVFNSRKVKRGDYEATIDITSGHVVTWRYPAGAHRIARRLSIRCRKRRLLCTASKASGDRLECRGGQRTRSLPARARRARDLLDLPAGADPDGERQGMLHPLIPAAAWRWAR
jgi:hypothetical protein